MGVMCLTAARYNHSLIVNLKSGDKVEYKFEADPQVSFSGADMVIKAGDQTVKHAIPDLENLTFTKTVGINDARADKAEIAVSVSKNEVIVEGLQPGMTLSVYTADGRRAASATAAADGSARLSTDGLAPGVYVASTPLNSFKFAK